MVMEGESASLQRTYFFSFRLTYSYTLHHRQISFASGEKGCICQKRRDNKVIALQSPSRMGAVFCSAFDATVSNKGGELTVNWPAACVGA